MRVAEFDWAGPGAQATWRRTGQGKGNEKNDAGERDKVTHTMRGMPEVRGSR